MRDIFAIVNPKGGVGESSTSLALACGLAATGQRVLAIDLDAQGNMSYTLDATGDGPSALEGLTQVVSIQKVLRHT